jgi:hypothetical protein
MVTMRTQRLGILRNPQRGAGRTFYDLLRVEEETRRYGPRLVARYRCFKIKRITRSLLRHIEVYRIAVKACS